MIAQRHGLRHGAQLERVQHVAGEGGPAEHDLVARIEQRDRKVRDQAVGAGAVRDLVDLDTEPLGQRRAQPVGARVGVAVEIVGLGLENLAGNREGPEGTLVGGKLGDTGYPELALDLLDRLAGFVRCDRLQGGPDEAPVSTGSFPHARTLSSAGDMR